MKTGPTMLEIFAKAVMGKANEAVEKQDYDYIAESADELKEMIGHKINSLDKYTNPEQTQKEVMVYYNLRDRLLDMLR